MGYLHDTAVSYYIPPNLAHRVTGTWSSAAGQVAGTIAVKPNDANQTSTLTIPMIVPSNSVALKGCYLKSIELDFEITGAALDAVTATINKVSRGADTAAATVAAVTFTYDTGHDDAAERIDVDQHKMTLTITTPFWIDNDEYVLAALSVDQAGDTGILEFLGAVANVTLRL